MSARRIVMDVTASPPGRGEGLGIVGGFGPEATARLYVAISADFAAQMASSLPRVVIESVAQPAHLARACVHGTMSSRLVAEQVELINAAIGRLRRAEVDGIVIPCNSVLAWRHRLALTEDDLDPVRATLARLDRDGVGRYAVIASSSTIAHGLFEGGGGRAVYPPAAVQSRIVEAIDDLIAGRRRSAEAVIRAATHGDWLAGVDALVFGCTDLSVLLDGGAAWPRPVVDSLGELRRACAARLVEGARRGPACATGHGLGYPLPMMAHAREERTRG